MVAPPIFLIVYSTCQRDLARSIIPHRAVAVDPIAISYMVDNLELRLRPNQTFAVKVPTAAGTRRLWYVYLFRLTKIV